MGSWLGWGIAAVIVIWAILTYNKLVSLRNRVANALAQIDVQLRRRYDLVPNLVEIARKYIAHESQTLEAVTRARSVAVSANANAKAQPNATTLGALATAEVALNGEMGRLFGLVENYPELKADQSLRDLHEEITSSENRVSFARQAYNDEVLAYNDGIAHAPDLVVARLAGFVPAALLQSIDSEEQRATMRIQL